MATTYQNTDDLEKMVARFDVTTTFVEAKEKIKDKGKGGNRSLRAESSQRSSKDDEIKTERRHRFELKQRYQEYLTIRPLDKYVNQDKQNQVIKIIPNFGQFMLNQRPNYVGEKGTLLAHTSFKCSLGDARIANDHLELTLRADDFTKNTCEIDVLVYQYTMPNMNDIHIQKPTWLEKAYKFKLFIMKQQLVENETAQLGSLITINGIPKGLELSPLLRDDIVLQVDDANQSAKVTIAKAGRDLMLHAQDKT